MVYLRRLVRTERAVQKESSGEPFRRHVRLSWCKQINTLSPAKLGRKRTSTLETISTHDIVQVGDKKQSSTWEAEHGGTIGKICRLSAC